MTQDANKPSSPAPLPASVEMERDLIRASVRTADVLHEFKNDVKWDADGRHFTVDISSPAARAKFKEMRRPQVRKMVEIQHKKSDAMPTVIMRDQRGGRRFINQKIADAAGRVSGFREASAMSNIGVRRTHVDERHFCPDCGSRWSWCECVDV